MDFAEYQRLASRTDTRDGYLNDRLTYGALGLAGEAGELVEAVKHGVFHGHAMDIDHYTEELGDVLWYVAFCARTYGISLEEIAERNIAKLKKRYPEGYSNEASIARVDVKGA